MRRELVSERRMPEHCQGDFALAGMIHDGSGVVLSDATAGGALLFGGQGPRLVDLCAGHAGELGNEAADVDAFGIELLRLEHRVEDPEVRRGVRAAARRPLPAAVVVREVGVGELVLEPALTLSPVDVQVFGQERGRDHPRPVVHPVRRRELAHRGVDQRKAGASALPGLETGRILHPCEAVELGTEALGRDARKMEEDVVVELAPGELEDEPADVLALARRRVPPGAPRPRPGSCAPRWCRSADAARAARCPRRSGRSRSSA